MREIMRCIRPIGEHASITTFCGDFSKVGTTATIAPIPAGLSGKGNVEKAAGSRKGVLATTGVGIGITIKTNASHEGMTVKEQARNEASRLMSSRIGQACLIFIVT